MTLQVNDICKENMLRMRIVTDVTVPFLAVVSVNGTSYYLKHCNGGSKADNLFKIEDRKADILVSIVPSDIRLLKECLEKRCSPTRSHKPLQLHRLTSLRIMNRRRLQTSLRIS
ncbi:hypothetical protein AAVH_27075 [Aphelenchoides avenae]|nr:hypothetical protein AAVH_27075 [Aphelenchus avenae]